MYYLSDQQTGQRSSDMGDAELLDDDEIGDLIDLLDGFIGRKETHSARFKGMEGIKIKSRWPTESIDGNEPDSLRPLSFALNNYTAQEYRDEIAEQSSSQGSDYTPTSQGSKVKVWSSDQYKYASRTPNTEKSASFEATEEKIPYWNDDQIFGPSSPTPTTMSRLNSISTTRSGAATYRSSFNNDMLPSLFPPISSPFSERFLPSEHGWNNFSASIPHSDKEVEDCLFKTMSQILSSPQRQRVTRLDWAEDVLRHCTISAAHAIRMIKMDPKSNSGNPLLSEMELKMMETAIQILKELQHAQDGRAYFLGARYIESGEEKEALHLLAYRNGYVRSLFYLGKLSEDRKLIEEARKRYEDAARREDAACLQALARAHLNGHLGVKKDKQTGILLLQRAAASADKDYPDPLYDLALLHLEPPPSKVKSRFKLRNSKSLVAFDPATAIGLLRKASLLGHAPSQLRLGQLYLTGLNDVSIMALRKASLRRDSQVSTSTTSMASSNIETDPALARHYLHLAAQRGLAEADYEIARCIMMSTDDTSKLSKEHARLAVTHASRALFDKVPLAYGIMGKIYEDGIGTRKNLEKAEKVYFEGGKKGDAWARKRSDELRSRGVGVGGTDAIYKRDAS
ncbi:hypothetical protein Vi05172_g6392 [Venturia inaequalis]|nr:hypothetical protein Vi05172_g6392 [Venturia inaequalis]